MKRSAVALSLALFSGCTQVAVSNVGNVRRSDLVQRVTVAGTVIPRKRTVVMAPYNGYIRKLYVRVGEAVKSGDPVVTVTQNLSDASEVYPLRAPFAGTVAQVLHSDGEYVESSGENNIIVRIDDLGKLFVLADVPEIEMVKLRDNQEVIVKAAAVPSRSYPGRIREIFRAAREKKGWDRSSDKVEFPVRIELTAADDALKPGMSALVDIVTAKREKVLTLRHEFVQKAADKYFAIMADGQRRDIEVGLANEEMFEITKGLSEGEKVRQTEFQ